MKKKDLLNQLQGKLTVSCQALSDEPLHSSLVMSKMAKAAVLGGAVAIRANGKEDILRIKEEVSVPIIGLVKKDYVDSEVYITPTIHEVEELHQAGCEIIAVDATNRIRPGGVTLELFVQQLHEKYSDQIFMADVSTYEEGVRAMELGFDLIATTLAGYTTYTENISLPAFSLLEQLVEEKGCPVMAEGGYWTGGQLQKALELGAHGCIVGSAITRPLEITKHFAAYLQPKETFK